MLFPEPFERRARDVNKMYLWAEHEASSTMPNFSLHAVFFVIESNIAYNLESK